MTSKLVETGCTCQLHYNIYYYYYYYLKCIYNGPVSHHNVFITFVLLNISIKVAGGELPLSIVRFVFRLQPAAGPCVCGVSVRNGNHRQWLDHQCFNSYFRLFRSVTQGFGYQLINAICQNEDLPRIFLVSSFGLITGLEFDVVSYSCC